MTTNIIRSVVYIGMTNSLERRMAEHKAEAMGRKKTFCGIYNSYYLIYTERFQYVHHAIRREKELKGWTREKKEALINSVNPGWEFIVLE
ncbi:MAG: nuclease superfamily protein [Flavipsychrobacter sp.]|nr:nuclease superfamily protein [Flavipsychrobacter sp.]